MGGWRGAQSPILITTITVKRFHKRGYISLKDDYLKVSKVNKPLPVFSGRPVRTVM